MGRDSREFILNVESIIVGGGGWVVVEGMRFLMLGFGCLFFVSCAEKVVVDDGLVRSGPAMLGGAKVRSAVLPLKGEGLIARDLIVYKAQSAELDGPFRWSIEAKGDAGALNWMVVHDVKIETSRSKRVESFPSADLGKKVMFELVPLPPEKKGDLEKKRKVEKKREVVARFDLPGILQVYPKADGVVRLIALVEINGAAGMKDWVKFSMAPGATKSRPFRFLPSVVEVGGAPVEVPEVPGAVVEPDFDMPEPLPDAEFPLPVH